MINEKRSVSGRWHRAFAFIRPYRAAVAVIVALTLASGSVAALEPLVLKLVFDALAGDSARTGIALGLCLLPLGGFAHVVCAGLNNWLAWRTRLRVHYDLLSATVERLHALPLAYHQRDGVGATMTRLDRGVQGAANGISEITFNVLPSIVYFGVAAVVMLRLDWRMALAVIVFVPIPAIIGALASGEQTRRERGLLERWTRIYARFNEVLGGILVVKTFAMEEAEKQRFLGGVSDANDVVVSGVARDSWIGASREAVVVLARLCALAVGVGLMARGSMTIGTMVAFMGYVAGLFAPVQGLVGTYQTLRRTTVALDTVFSIFDAQNALGDAPDAEEVRHVRGEVCFDNVGFSYDGRGAVLNGVCLHVHPGEVIGIVGASGSGKSTLMCLLQRIYDPSSGAILLDGKDLRGLRQRSLRRQFGVVLQDSLLFNDTVRHNILYGRPDAGEAEMLHAARVAHADNFISCLPQTYDTIIGEKGSMLSAGQRQRLAIARAILKDPAILILDEATSSLDVDTEGDVRDALSKLMKGRTTFIVAHRLAAVSAAHRIVVLDGGRIAEMGSRVELLQRGGVYYAMARRQVEGVCGGDAMVLRHAS